MKKHLIHFICPNCSLSFKKKIELKLMDNISTILIKSHPNGKDCPPFLAYIDAFGEHRGSQKVDSIEKDILFSYGFITGNKYRITVECCKNCILDLGEIIGNSQNIRI